MVEREPARVARGGADESPNEQGALRKRFLQRPLPVEVEHSLHGPVGYVVQQGLELRVLEQLVDRLEVGLVEVRLRLADNADAGGLMDERGDAPRLVTNSAHSLPDIAQDRLRGRHRGCDTAANLAVGAVT